MLTASIVSAVGMILLPIGFTITGTENVLTLNVLTVALVVALFNAVFSWPVEFVCRWALREPSAAR